MQITGHNLFGPSIYPFTLYRIEITQDNEHCTIYRRYNDFLVLNNYLVDDKKELKVKIYFPCKAMLSQRSEIIELRLKSLQNYLNVVLEVIDIGKDKMFLKFVDHKMKGKSRACQDLPKNHIVFETICQIKRGVLPIEIWSTYFVVLTKHGTIFVFSNIYDHINNPLVAYPVSSVTQIDSRSGAQIITLTHRVNKQKLILKLSNDDELASWLRKLSDLNTLDLISDNSEQDKFKTDTTPMGFGRAEANKADDLSILYGV